MEWKINWKRKLTSRKFWLAVAGFVGPLMLAFGASEAVASQVTALIMAGAALASIPIIVVFIAFQKYFTQGIAMGAVKG